MEGLAVSSGVAGLLSLGITICQGLLDYYGSWKDAPSNVSQMNASIEALTKTLLLLTSAIQHKFYDPDVVERVEDCIKSVEEGFQSLKKKLDKVRLVPLQEGWKAKAKAQLHRYLYPFKESTLAKLKELGNELRDDLALALDLLHIDSSAAALQRLDLVGQTLTSIAADMTILKDGNVSISANVEDLRVSTKTISGSVDKLALAQSRDYTRKVWDWLSPLPAKFYRKHLDTFNIPNRQDGTAQWFTKTQEYRHWLSATGANLWCPGIPGAGKTVLASYIINHIQNLVDLEAHSLTYIYFSYKDAAEQTVPNLLMSLISQLASLESPLPEELTASYEAHKSGEHCLSYGESVQWLRRIVMRCTKVFLIVDAFDECPEEWRSQLLAELYHLRPKMNTLITSRNLPNIERQLPNVKRLKIEAQRDDLLHYIQERVATSDRIQSHVRKDPTLDTLISSTIAARADGMFLQARLHVDSLATATTLRKFKEALMSLPEGLSKTYDETFERVHAQHQDLNYLARKALYWVFYASRPLTMVELQHALAVEIGDRTLDEDNIPDEELLLSACNGLLVYQKESGNLSLVHYTLQEYLNRKADIVFPKAQTEMAKTCLTYLLFEEFGKGPCYEHESYEIRTRQWSLLKYAVFKWGHHVHASGEEDCKDLIMSFLSCSTNLSASIQVLCVRESFGFGYSQLYPKNVHALWLASFYGLEDTVLCLLAKDPRIIDIKSSWGDTALHRAAGCGHMNVVRMLLDNGADPRVKDGAGNTPLHLATLDCNDISAHDIFRSSLLEYRGRMVQQVRTLNYSLAVKNLLLTHGSDIDAKNLRGESALHLAVMDGHLHLSQLLLKSGADVTLRDRNGLGPLSIACECGHLEVTKMLLGCDLPKQIQLGMVDDALRRAAYKDHLPLLKVLVSKFPEHLPTDPEGRNQLHRSSNEGNLKCLEYLANLGFDLQKVDKQGRTCLHHAATGPGEAVEFLLEHGLDPKQPDIDGWTPLVWAAKGAPLPIVRRLLDAGGVPGNGKEWLPYAVASFYEDDEYGDPKVVAFLRPPRGTTPESFEVEKLRTSLMHSNVYCDGCEYIIFGTRYKCLICTDFDYCFKCYRSAKITHKSHEFTAVYWDDVKAEELDHLDIKREVQLREAMMMGTHI